jgi:hypothetical protein
MDQLQISQGRNHAVGLKSNVNPEYSSETLESQPQSQSQSQSDVDVEGDVEVDSETQLQPTNSEGSAELLLNSLL